MELSEQHRPKALDLFCCAGGASEGLRRAGFDVTGVDIRPQPRYQSGTFVQDDALDYPLTGFDLIWASPPCQRYTAGRRAQRNRGDADPHPDLIETVRARLINSGIPYIIENVAGAPLANPIMLCGEMFSLRVIRHRYFESSLPLVAPPHPSHRGTLLDATYVPVYGGKWICSGAARKGKDEKYANYGRVPRESRTVECWREAMGIQWMTGKELQEAIPPDYSEYLGLKALRHIGAAACPS